jgi:hypothetical protein
VAPNPVKKVLCGGAAVLGVAPPNPLNMLLVAGVLAVFCALELVAAKVNAGVEAPEVALVVLNMLVGSALVLVKNMFVEGALLVVPNRLPVPAAVVVLFCARPPKGLPDGCEPNIAPPPNAGAAPLPFIADVPFDWKGFVGLALPAVKLKSVADGGWGLKPVPWLLAPNAGNDELEKELLGAADCAGGKLFVEPPPKALLLPPNMPFVLLLPPTAGAGADAPKLKPPCGVPKFALCEGVCMRALASCCSCLRRISRRPAAVWYLLDMAARVGGCGGWRARMQRGCTHGSSSCGSPYFGSLDSGGQRVSASGDKQCALWRGRPGRAGLRLSPRRISR